MLSMKWTHSLRLSVCVRQSTVVTTRINHQNILESKRTTVNHVNSQQVRHFSFAYYASPEFPPVGYAQQLLELTHSTTGLPWWATIAVTTFALRTAITLPLFIYSSKVLSKVTLLQPEIKDLAEELKGEVFAAGKKYGWNAKMAKAQFNSNLKRIIRDLYIRDNCHPFKASIVVLFQLPLWFSMSFALRNMAGALPMKEAANVVLTPDLATGGTLWFSNLLVPDTTFILPVTMAVCNLLVIEMNALKKGEASKLNKIITNFFRGLSIVLIPVASTVPSCMCLYWTCSSFFGLLQNVVTRFPSVRRFCRIPEVPDEPQTPFKDLYQLGREKYFKKKSKNTQDPE